MHGVLGEALVAACRRFGTALALTDGAAQWSYDDLLLGAQAVAEALRAAGLARNDVVHVAVSNQASDLVALFGVWLVGGVAVLFSKRSFASF